MEMVFISLSLCGPYLTNRTIAFTVWCFLQFKNIAITKELNWHMVL